MAPNWWNRGGDILFCTCLWFMWLIHVPMNIWGDRKLKNGVSSEEKCNEPQVMNLWSMILVVYTYRKR